MTARGTIKIFGAYLLLLGFSGMLIPNVLLRALGLPETTEVWVRVAAMLVANYGLLYVWIIRTRSTAIMWYTVFARILVFFYLAAFTFAGLTQPMIMIFGVLDGVGGLWTWWALHRDERAAASTANGRPHAPPAELAP
jgi:hypothetical protein